jgi:DNA-binding transcriptional regulator LsrR (DeoR family)
MDRLIVQAVAYLHSSNQGLTQEEIAERLGVSQATVSRYIAQAIEAELLVPRRPMFVAGRLTDERLGELQQFAYRHHDDLKRGLERLAERTPGSFVPQFHVIDSGSVSEEPARYDARVTRVAKAAAFHVARQIGGLRIVGIPWGATMAQFVAAVEGCLEHPPREESPITFVPLAGETRAHSFRALSASDLVVRLHRIINGSTASEDGSGRGMMMNRTLFGVPARIPLKFERSKRVIQEFIRDDAGFRAVFGDFVDGALRGDSLVARMDTMFTGVGAIQKRRRDAWHSETMTAEEMRSEDVLKERTHGDICGVFLPRQGHEAWVEGVNSRLIALRLDDIRACARRARERDAKGTLGVCLLAVGRPKAEPIHACLTEGLINHMFIDHDAANGLVRLLGK